MEGGCHLCSKKDVLFNYQFTSKCIQNAFFSVHKKLFMEDCIKDMQLCIICAHKLQLSTELKKQYDEMCNRNNILSVKKCFFCENKPPDLISLDKNVNGIQEKLRVFLTSVIVQHNYKSFCSCIKCLFSLDIWFNMRKDVFEIMKISEPAGEKDTESFANQSTYNAISRSRNKGRIQKASETNRKNQENVPEANTVKNDDATNNNVTSTRNTRKSDQNNGKKQWFKYLKKKLKSFETINKMMENGDITLSSSINEHKLLKTLPFVEIFVNSQISKNQITQDNEVDIPTIVLSDTEEITPTTRTRRRLGARLNLSLKKDINRKKPLSLTMRTSRRNAPKIKSPIKRQLSLKKGPRIANSVDENSSSESVLSIIDLESENSSNVNEYEPDETLMCNTCDKIFTLKLEFLSHKLKHEKPEDLVINVRRYRLPEKLDVSQLSPKKELAQAFASPAKISRLLTKWIDENAAKQYQDADRVCSDESMEDQDESKTTSEEPMETEDTDKSETLVNKDTDKSIMGTESTDKSETLVNRDPDKSIVGTENIDKSETLVNRDTNKSIIGTENTDKSNTLKTKHADKSSEIEIEDADQSLETRNAEIDSKETESNPQDQTKKQTESESEKKTHEKENDKIESEDDENVEKESKDKAAGVTEDSEDENDKESAENRERSKGGTNVKKNDSKENEKGITSKDDANKRQNEEVNSTVKGCGTNEKSTSLDVEKGKSSASKSKPDIESTDEDLTELLVVRNETMDSLIDLSDGQSRKEGDNEKIHNSDSDSDTTEIIEHQTEIIKETANGNKENESVILDDSDKEEENKSGDNSSVMTCEDLLNILETNISADNLNSGERKATVELGKRKRPANDEDTTPKRKKVRFAEEKEVFTPDKSESQLERLIENDQFLQEEAADEDDKTS